MGFNFKVLLIYPNNPCLNPAPMSYAVIAAELKRIGIRLGYMISQKDNIEYFSKTRSITKTDAFSINAAQYIIDNDQIIKDYVSDVKKGAIFLKVELKKINIKIIGGDVSNTVLIFPPSEVDLNSFYNFLINNKIYTRKGFISPYKNCLRITLGPIKEMQELIRIIKLYFA